MAVEKKSRSPFAPVQREKNFEAPPSVLNLLQENGDFTIWYGRLHGHVSYYLIGIFDGQYYSYKIECVHRFEELKKRFEGRGCMFKKNLSTNPFMWWKETNIGLSIPDYKVIRSSESYQGGFHGRCYETDKGTHLDFADEIGVSIQGYHR